MYQTHAQAFDFATRVQPGAPLSAVIVVPCYNEARRLEPATFAAYLEQAPQVRFLFVDDGSTDATGLILAALKARHPGRIDVLPMTRNSGKAEAVRHGLLAATGMGADVVGYWDADLATPLDAIDDFLRVATRVSQAQVIFGSRRTMLGHRINRTLGRRVISRICAGLARIALGMPVADTQCGAKMLRVTDQLRAALEQPFQAAWLFDVELFSRLCRKDGQDNRRFYELPLDQWTEVPGSKVSAKAVIRAGGAMLRLILANRVLSQFA